MTPPAGSAEGVLVVDKPAGPTSHDVVARVRRLFATRRVGHAGTLDPPATGVLLIGLGRATRLLRFLQSLEKVYTATVVFGVSTTTQDATGEVVERRPCGFTDEALRAEALRFLGDIEQIPPMVSAVKVGGEPLYRAARRGETVDRAPRRVRIHELTVEAFTPAAATTPPAPIATLPAPIATAAAAAIRVRCSSGTYVRTLASDLGDRLGCGAHLSSLRRLAIGSFRVSEAPAGSGAPGALGAPEATTLEATTLEALESMDPAARCAAVLPMTAALRDFPSVSVAGPVLDRVRNGRPIDLGDLGDAGDLSVPPAARVVAVLDPAGELVAVYEPHPEAGTQGEAAEAAGTPGPARMLRPVAVLAAASEAMASTP